MPGGNHLSPVSPPPALADSASRASRRPVRRAHFQIGGVGPRCSDANCRCEDPTPSSAHNSVSTTVPDEPDGSSDSSLKSPSAMPGGMNLEVSNRPSPSSPFCSIGVPDHEPNTQLRPDTTGPEMAAMFLDYSDELGMAATVGEWQDVDFDTILDSGCSRHVAPMSCVPGYHIQETQLSRAGHKFQVANGETVPNLGDVVANLGLETEGGEGRTVASTFAVCDMTSPLMSVHQICQNGHTCTFTKDHALVLSSDGEVLAKLPHNNGAYRATLKLKAPSSPFGGQGR